VPETQPTGAVVDGDQLDALGRGQVFQAAPPGDRAPPCRFRR
jgi:hypothetical protein